MCHLSSPVCNHSFLNCVINAFIASSHRLLGVNCLLGMLTWKMGLEGGETFWAYCRPVSDCTLLWSACFSLSSCALIRRSFIWIAFFEPFNKERYSTLIQTQEKVKLWHEKKEAVCSFHNKFTKMVRRGCLTRCVNAVNAYKDEVLQRFGISGFAVPHLLFPLWPAPFR